MSNPHKHWSWGMAIGRGTGAALASAVTGGVLGSLSPAVGAPLGGTIAAAGGFASGFLSTALGHLWDEPPEAAETFGSAALYTTVVGGLISAFLGALMLNYVAGHPETMNRVIFGSSVLSGFIASMSKSLIDDLRAAERGRRLRDDDWRMRQ